MTPTTTANANAKSSEEVDEASQDSLETYWQASFEDSRRIAWLAGQVDSLRVENVRLSRELEAAVLHLSGVDRGRVDALAQLHEVRTSRSWRAAAPLRWVGAILRRLAGR